MKTIVVIPDNGGVEYYRLKSPFDALSQKGLDVIYIDRIGTVAKNETDEVNVDELLKDVSTVWFSRVLDKYGKHQEVADRIHKAGAKIVLDIDDFWKLPPDHVLSYTYKKYNATAQIEQCIKLADMVVTTHSLLASEIERINPNVVIVPNAIPQDKQFERRPTKSDKIRFGWVGGICHLEDVKLLQSTFNKLYRSELKHKVQIFLCGYTRDTNRKMIDKSGRTWDVPVDKETYNQYEKIFTADYMLRPEYVKYLNQMSVTPDKEIEFDNEIYQRRWGREITNFATFYNEFDVALAPLKENYFNRCKSELKAIEAGWMGKAVIASNIHPYTNILNESNSCLVKGNDWMKHIRKLTTQHNFRNDIAERLHEDVVSHYDLEKVNRTRIQILNHYEAETSRTRLPERNIEQERSQETENSKT